MDLVQAETPPSANSHRHLAKMASDLLLDLMREHPLAYVPTLEWKNFRVTAGMAYYRVGKIALSRHVIQDETSLVTTLKHEYAHLLAFVRYGKLGIGHGAGWQQAMRDLGLEPKVRHNFEVSRNKARQRVIYECQRCLQLIVRARKFPGRRRYLHVACGGAIRLKRVEAVTSDRLTA